MTTPDSSRLPRTRTRFQKRPGVPQLQETWYPTSPTEKSLGKTIMPPLLRTAWLESITDYPRKKVSRANPRELGIDKGGPFILRRTSIRHWGNGWWFKTSRSPRYMTSESTYVEKKDFVSFKSTDLLLPTWNPDFTFWGPKAFKRMKPTSNGSFGQFIVEARDLPSIPLSTRHQLDKFRAAGREYLNVEFGWKPFLRDLKDFFRIIEDVDKKWRYLLRKRNVRIRKRVPILFQDSSSVYTAPTYGKFINRSANTQCYPGWDTKNETKLVSDITETRYWASGAFRFSLPNISLPGIPEHDFRLLYNTFGVLPTPALVYKVIPWTWLVDWFTNLGAIIDNYEAYALDGVVAEWAYVMAYWHNTKITHVTGPWGAGTMILKKEVKARDQASPYGFGVSLDSLTSSQMAILAALGLAKKA